MADRSLGASTPPRDDGNDNVLHTFVSILRRRTNLVVAGVLFGLAVGVTWTITVPAPGSGTKYYKATTTLVLLDNAGGQVDPGLPVLNTSPLPTALQYAQSRQLTDAIAERFDLATATAVQRLSAERLTDAAYPAVGITALATSPETAENMADHAALLVIGNTGRDDIAVGARSRLQTTLSGLEQQRAGIEQRITAEPADADSLRRQLLDVQSQISGIQDQLDALATVPDSPMMEVLQPARAIRINAKGFAYRVAQNDNAQSSLTKKDQRDEGPDFDETNLAQSWPPPKPLRIPIGLVLGLLAGFGLAALAEAWDDRIRTREDAERVTGHPVLAEIPGLDTAAARRGLVILDDEMMLFTERVRSIRTALELALLDMSVPEGRAPVILVTSPSPAEGKTTVVANLAAAFAIAGSRTLAIDGDFRRPTLHRRLDPVRDTDTPDGPQRTPVADLSYLSGAAHDAQPDVAIEAIEDLVHDWRTSYDVIVLDTPPILTTNDAADLLRVADLVVVVVRSGQTRHRMARRVTSLLQRLRADVAGVVVNASEVDPTERYNGYTYTRRTRDAETQPRDPAQAARPSDPASTV